MQLTKNIVSAFIIFILFLVVLELITRVTVYVVKGPVEVRRDVISDNKFGWVHTTQTPKKIRKNKCGEKVVRLSLKHKLINKFPKYSSEKHILFIGDSFTHAHEVSTGKAFYDVFEENTKDKYAVYAAGVGGYGNLQEFLVLESVYDEVKPDIVVWQLCGNDVANNIYELDNASFFNNQRPRPYYNPDDGRIETKNPGFWLFDLSLGFKFVFLKVFTLDTKYDLGILHYLNKTIALSPDEKQYHVKKGLQVLSALLEKAKQKYPETTFYGFSVDCQHDDAFERIFNEEGAIYFKSFYNCVDIIEGTNCEPLDAHWNHMGNKVAGDALTKLIGG